MVNSTRSSRILIAVAIVLITSGACMASPSRLHLLDGPREALQARFDLIQQAQHTIDVAYYAIDTDEVPVAIIELLRQASLRGVRVRILVDGFKSRIPSRLEKYLRRFAIQMRVYHLPGQGHPKWLNRRLHSKLMVFDGKIAIIGSRNLENEYYEFGPERKFADCDALIADGIVEQTQAYFDWLWSCPDVQPASDRDLLVLDLLKFRPRGCTPWKRSWRKAKTAAQFQCLLTHALRRVVCCGNIQLDSGRDWLAVTMDQIQMSLLHDGCSDKSVDHVQRGIVQMMDSARCTLLIESPYPAFDDEIRAAIARARCRGVIVTILTNSLETTDEFSVYAAYQNQKRGLLREGVQIHEYCGNETLHAKTMVVDDTAWMLGSYNFDARSDNLNLELCIISDDPAGAAAVRAHVQKRLRKSTRIDDGKLLLPVGHAAALVKRVRLGLHRPVAELLRGFL